jgi:hypothetical protein
VAKFVTNKYNSESFDIPLLLKIRKYGQECGKLVRYAKLFGLSNIGKLKFSKIFFNW